MTRRDLAFLAAAAPPKQYRTYARCWPDFLTRLATAAYNRRKAALAQLTTPGAIGQRQAWVRDTLWTLIGGEPPRTPLNIRTTGSFARDGYRVEKITYESQPGLVIPANLYTPTTGRAPYPGVLFQMGHALNGKGNEGYQRCCQGLARLGFVVLAFDPMGQGERTYYPRGQNGTLTRLDSADTEHTMPGQQMLLAGDSATRLQLWDAVRSLDVLAEHADVDKKRLASTGQSGGATLTMLLAAVDPRLAAAALTCGNTENYACRAFNAPGSTDDAEQNFVNAAAHGFDRWDLLYPLAPKPLLIEVSARDFYGTYSPNYLESGREEFAALQRVYARLGAKPENLAWVEQPLPHGLSEPLRLDVYNWFRRFLQNEPTPLTAEPPTAPETDEMLWTGRSGNVIRDHASLRPIDLVRQRLAKIPNEPKAPDFRAALAVQTVPPSAPAVLGTTRFGGVRIEAVEVPSEAPVYLPGWLYHPEKTKGDLVVILDPSGRASRWQEGQLFHEVARAGYTVCAADVRGVGDLRPEVSRGALGHALNHTQEDHWAWASLMLGRPVLGQRITDILAWVRSLNFPRKHLAAAGRMVTPAAIAAALDPSVNSLQYYGRVTSLRALAQMEEYEHPFADFVPGLLLQGDLPSALLRVRHARPVRAWTANALLESLSPPA